MKARRSHRVRAVLGAAGVVAVAAACSPGGPDMSVVRLPRPVAPTDVAAAPAVTVVAGDPGSVVPPATVPVPAVSVAPSSTTSSPPTSSPAPLVTLPALVVVPAPAPSIPVAVPSTSSPPASASWSVVDPPVADGAHHALEGVECHPFPGGSAYGRAMPEYASRLFELQNELRQQHGLAPLARDDLATTAADGAAARLAITHELAHYTTGAPCRVLSLEQYAGTDGTWSKLAENVGVAEPSAGDVDAMFGAYVASPGHLDNILDPAFDRVGVATYVSVEDGRTLQWNAVVFAGSPSEVDTVVGPPAAAATR